MPDLIEYEFFDVGENIFVYSFRIYGVILVSHIASIMKESRGRVWISFMMELNIEWSSYDLFYSDQIFQAG